jgi:hypothetical protein
MDLLLKALADDDQDRTDKGQADKGHADKGHADKVDPETVTNAIKLFGAMVKDMVYIIRLKNKGWQKIGHSQRLYIVGAVDDIIVSMGFSPIRSSIDINDTTPERFKAHLEEVIEMVNKRYPYSRKRVCSVRFSLSVDDPPPFTRQSHRRESR